MKHHAQNKTEEEFHQEIKADTDNAQVLIQIGLDEKTLEEAKQTIEEMGVRITEMKSLSSHWILMKLDIKDMRSIALRLIESGFSNIKGINAINSKICDFP